MPLPVAFRSLHRHQRTLPQALRRSLLPQGLQQACGSPLSAMVGQLLAMSCRYSVSGAVPRGLKVAMQRRHLALHRVVGRQVGAQRTIQQQGQQQFTGLARRRAKTSVLSMNPSP